MEEYAKTMNGAADPRPWARYYGEEELYGRLPEGSIYETLWENNRNSLDCVAIRYYARRITYGELFVNIDRCAGALAAEGVSAGEIVAVALPSLPEALYAFYAANRLGAAVCAMHPSSDRETLVRRLNDTRARVAFLSERACRALGGAASRTEARRIVGVGARDSLPLWQKLLHGRADASWRAEDGRFQTWRGFLHEGRNTGFPVVRKDCGTPALIAYPGPAGASRGVVLSDGNVNALAWQLGHRADCGRRDVTLIVLPPHVNQSPLNGMLEHLALGHQIVLVPGGQSDNFADYVCQYRPVHVNSEPAARAPGSVGIPLARSGCKVVAPGTCEPLPPGQPGEICFSGPTVLLGYFNDPDATARAIETDAGGVRWLHTGRVGRVGEGGAIFLSDGENAPL